jgi:hypothetical protein
MERNALNQADNMNPVSNSENYGIRNSKKQISYLSGLLCLPPY